MRDSLTSLTADSPHRYHCLYCHGYEERERGPAGVLAVGMVANAGPALQLARNAAQLCGEATIFTHGAEPLGVPVEEHIGHCLTAMQARAAELGL